MTNHVSREKETGTSAAAYEVPRTVPEASDSVGDMEQQFAQGNNSSDQDPSTAIIDDALPVVAFATRAELRNWLHLEHARSSGT